MRVPWCGRRPTRVKNWHVIRDWILRWTFRIRRRRFGLMLKHFAGRYWFRFAMTENTLAKVAPCGSDLSRTAALQSFRLPIAESELPGRISPTYLTAFGEPIRPARGNKAAPDWVCPSLGGSLICIKEASKSKATSAGAQ